VAGFALKQPVMHNTGWSLLSERRSIRAAAVCRRRLTKRVKRRSGDTLTGCLLSPLIATGIAGTLWFRSLQIPNVQGRVNHAAGSRQRRLLPQSKNPFTFGTLAKKNAIQGGVPQLRRLGIKQRAEENSRRIRAMRLTRRNFLITRRATN
jgi:hypothetical protein